MTLLLTRSDLERALVVDEVIETVEAAFAAYSGGRTVTPLRVGVEPPGADGVLLAMPCAVAEPPALGAKIVSVFRGNPARGLPTVTSIYVLSGYETGAPLAIMDGGYLTGLRTAAGSAVATRHLARPDARTLGVFGTGVQARFHLETVSRVRRLEQVLVAGTSVAAGERFSRWVEETIGIQAVTADPETVAGADIVAACTTSPTPLFSATSVSSGAHVNAVGAFVPSTRELPTQVIQHGRVFVDTRAGAFTEAGDLLIPVQEGAFGLESVAGEIGEVVLGRVAGRTETDQTTVYKSVGAAFLDAATAALAFERASALGLGQTFTFDR